MDSQIEIYLVSLISVILRLIIIRQFSMDLKSVQIFFLREGTEEGAFNFATFKVCRHFIYIYELVAHLFVAQEEFVYFHDHRIGFSNF